ncbi:unnamed protein product [Euphydryas editha]|uniref:Uncharacterized protein n=1 Tax=Euphydryas editha TaxID=104508 RepID=A0AAU9TVL2_EUPED|nr:unnamed protein product [Euphydryas editha]
MFKLTILCAFLAAASATPCFIAPLSYSSNILAPATTALSSYPRSVVYSSPYISSESYAYSSPLGYSHFIKKRSAPVAVSSYITPSAYFAPAAYASAPLATYTAAPYGRPFFSSTYTVPASHISTPVISSSPFFYNAQYIKK